MSRPTESRSFTASADLAPGNGPDQGVRRGLVPISVAALLWGSTGVIVQVVHNSTALSAIGIGFYRLAIAAVALFALRPRAGLRALRSAPLGLVLAGVGLGAYQALYFVAVTLAGVSIATVVSLGLAPVLLAGWEALQHRRFPGLRAAATLIGAIAGLLLVVQSTGAPTRQAPNPGAGLLAALACGCCYAAATAVSRDLVQRIDGTTLAAVTSGIGALSLLPLMLLDDVDAIVLPWRPVVLLMLLYLGVVATALAYALFYAGLHSTPGSTAAVLTLLEPLAAAGLAILLLGEELSLSALSGAALLLAAVAGLYAGPARVSSR
jgi:drug/metabolite transporter, DME family